MVVTMGKFLSLILYLSVYILSALCLHFATCSSKKINRIILAIIAILLPCILAGFRYGVGVDYLNYKYMYQSHSELSLIEYLQYDKRAEFAVYILSKIASIFNSQKMFFTLFSFFIYAPMAKVIMERKERKDTFFLALFFLLSSFPTGLNIMRQIAAASISMYSLKYVIDRNFKKFVLFIVFALMFHVSAIIILPIYFIWNKKNGFTIYQFKSWAIIAAYCIVAINLPFILQLISGRFDSYGLEQVQGRNLSIWLNCMWMVIYLLLHKYITKNRPQDGLFVFMIVIGTILSFTGIFNVYLKRTAIYFNYPEFILLIQLKNLFDFKSQRVFYFLATGYSLFIFILTYYILGQTGIFPYACMI